MTAAVPNITSHPYPPPPHRHALLPGPRQLRRRRLPSCSRCCRAGIFFPVAGLLLVSQLWERVGKELVFGKTEDDPDADDAIVLCGVDCPRTRYSATEVSSRALRRKWHPGEYRARRAVRHPLREAARILAALPQRAAEQGERKYVDAVAACILDVVDDTECDSRT